jgi:hypothetical protein
MKWKLAILAGVVLAISGIFAFIIEHRTARELSPAELRVQRIPAKHPDSPVLKTKPAPGAIRDRLLAGNFMIVRRTQDIPESCREIFDSSFVEADGAMRKGARVAIANPSEPFQSSDKLMPGRPFRRLLFAGLGSQTCLIYYQHGGGMTPRYCLAVMGYETASTLWVGESRKGARSLDDLRHLLSRHLFDDTGGPAC